MSDKKTFKPRAVLHKPLPDPKSANQKIRAWLLRYHPEEEVMLGDFREDVTFAELNRRMHEGENFYDICECTESQQREYVFAKMTRLYKTDYTFWYWTWLKGPAEA